MASPWQSAPIDSSVCLWDHAGVSAFQVLADGGHKRPRTGGVAGRFGARRQAGAPAADAARASPMPKLAATRSQQYSACFLTCHPEPGTRDTNSRIRRSAQERDGIVATYTRANGCGDLLGYSAGRDVAWVGADGAADGFRRVTTLRQTVANANPIADVRYIREGAWMPSSSSPCPRVRAVRSQSARRLPRTGSSVLRTGQAS